MIHVTPNVPHPYNIYSENLGKIMAISRNQILWRFGFSKNSIISKALNGKHTKNFLWVRSLYDGRIIEMIELHPASTPKYYSRTMQWVMNFDPNNSKQAELEELFVKNELIEQLISIINYGMQSVKDVKKLIWFLAKRRSDNPTPLEKLWGYTK